MSRSIAPCVSSLTLLALASAVPAVVVPATSHAQSAQVQAQADPDAPAWSEEDATTPYTTSSMDGSTGLFRMATANGLLKNHFHLSMAGDFFSGKDVIVIGDDDSRFGGRISLAWGVSDYVEIYGSLAAHSNQNSAVVAPEPELIQSVGNLTLGLRGYGEVTPGVALGAQVAVSPPAAAADVGLDMGASEVDLLALATFDFAAWSSSPLRAHLNLGYSIDGEEDLFKTELSRIERFGHDVRGYDSVRMAIGIDAPFQYVSPSLEFTLDVPVSPPCKDDPSLPTCLDKVGFDGYPSFLIAGLKTEPLAGLTFSLGGEFGMTTKESQGTPAIPAWTLLFGAAYELDPTPRIVERVVERRVEAPAATPAPTASAMSYVTGTIVDSATKKPIEGARVRYLNTEYSDQITNAAGVFRSYEVAPGTSIRIEISAPGYATIARPMTVGATPMAGQISMEQAIAGAQLAGRVTASDGAAMQATIIAHGPEDKTIKADPNTGAFELDLKPGEYEITVSAPGRTSTRDHLVLQNGRKDQNYSLQPLAAGQHLRQEGDLYVIDNPDQGVTFERDRLSGDSSTVLEEVVNLLKADPTLRLQVRSHTDSRDDNTDVRALTERRARAVVTWLTQHGIDASRLEAVGVGDSEPMFPNISDRNRRRNNRVDFKVAR